METKKDTRCVVKIPNILMEELRKIKDENYTSIPGVIALLIKLYRGSQND